MLGVQSRFAVLKIEGEESPRNPNKKKSEKPKVDVKKAQSQTSKQTLVKKKTTPNGQASNSKSKGKTNSKGKVTDAQWEEWKKKDEQYVDENYEGALQEAILQSKLDFEQNKDNYERMKKEIDAEKKLAAAGAKKKKNKAMSLGEFNNMQDNGENGVEDRESSSENSATAVDDPEFFDRIKEEAKQVIQKEHSKKVMKEREPFIDEAISMAQCRVKLEEKDAEIVSLKDELAQAKEDLLKVKSRNKKLCSIIGQAEVRDKAEILVQLDKLQHVKDELTDEVARLHAQLEQERSKVHSLTSQDSKGKGGKKRTASETHN